MLARFFHSANLRRLLPGCREQREGAGHEIGENEIIHNVQRDRPADAKFHGDDAEHQTSGKSKEALHDVAVEDAEKRSRGDDGKDFAILRQPAQHHATENDFFNDRPEETGVEHHRQRTRCILERIAGGVHAIAELFGDPAHHGIDGEKQNLCGKEQRDGSEENGRRHRPSVRRAQIAGKKLATAVEQNEHEAKNERCEGGHT